MIRSWIANKQFKREYLPDEDVNKLYSACRKWKEKFFLTILLETGMRVGELAKMKKEDIDFNDKLIRVYGKGGIYGTESKFRIIPLSTVALELMIDFFRHHEKEPKASRTIENIISLIKKRTDITRPVTPHVLRHTFAVKYLKRGGQLRTLQLLLGHDNIMTTQIYLSYTPQDVIADFNKTIEGKV